MSGHGPDVASWQGASEADLPHPDRAALPQTPGADVERASRQRRGIGQGQRQRFAGGVEYLMKKNKIAIIWGNATLDAPGKFTVKKAEAEAPKGSLGEGSYTAKHIIVATGARPRVLPGIEPDKKLVWTYFEAMNPDKMPKSLLVVGSGAIGIEFASFYRTMGAEVTV
eukprot:gene50957-69328_t